MGIPHTDISIQLKNSEFKKIVIGQGKNAKICYYPSNKKKKVSLYAASHSEIKFNQSITEVEEKEREERLNGIINMKLEMGEGKQVQVLSASKTRTRFMSKGRVNGK